MVIAFPYKMNVPICLCIALNGYKRSRSEWLQNVYPQCRTCGVIVDDIVDMGVTMAEANRKWEVTQFLVHEI